MDNDSSAPPGEKPPIIILKFDAMNLKPSGVLVELLKLQRKVEETGDVQAAYGSDSLFDKVMRALGMGIPGKQQRSFIVNKWIEHKASGKPDLEFVKMVHNYVLNRDADMLKEAALN